MADRTLLIPGTQATSLADRNGNVVYNAVRVSLGLQKDELGGRPPDEWQRLLSIDRTPGPGRLGVGTRRRRRLRARVPARDR